MSCLKWFSTVFESLNPICRINVVEKKNSFFSHFYPMLVVLQTSIVEHTLEMFLRKGFRSYRAGFKPPKKLQFKPWETLVLKFARFDLNFCGECSLLSNKSGAVSRITLFSVRALLK